MPWYLFHGKLQIHHSLYSVSLLHEQSLFEDLNQYCLSRLDRQIQEL